MSDDEISGANKGLRESRFVACLTHGKQYHNRDEGGIGYVYDVKDVCTQALQTSNILYESAVKSILPQVINVS